MGIRQILFNFAFDSAGLMSTKSTLTVWRLDRVLGVPLQGGAGMVSAHGHAEVPASKVGKLSTGARKSSAKRNNLIIYI